MDIEKLIGLTFTSVARETPGGDDEITFVSTEGRRFRMYHSQDCCETVTIDDIAGDLEDLVGAPILQAEEASSAGEGARYIDPVPEGFSVPDDPSGYMGESWTWTFYKLATIKGSVTIRWFGSSNGYYSESVNLVEVGGA